MLRSYFFILTKLTHFLHKIFTCLLYAKSVNNECEVDAVRVVKIIRLALENIFANRIRSILTSLGIIIGI